MRTRPTSRLLFLACLVVATLGWWITRDEAPRAPLVAPTPGAEVADAFTSAAPIATPITTRTERNYLVAEKMLDRLKNAFADGKARANEALLTFKDADAYRRFLARAATAGLRVLGKHDALRAVRIGFDSLAALEADLAAHAADYADIDANYFVYPPDSPEIDPRFAGKFVPIGDGLLQFLGVNGDTSKWGSGVTIAILDSGILADPTFGQGRVRYLDIGHGILPPAENGHGTAVASLAAGMSPEALGIAPGAGLLSIRVTGEDGLSDSFSLAQGVIAAVDAGAHLINISMGSYSPSWVMTNAIDYATARGVLLVASAGNDQATQLTWPAADSRVISVAAVDAAEQQVLFSNAGEGLKISAPGYGLVAAWTQGSRVSIDGTSGSAPVVAGGIAAMMSTNPGLTAVQAWSILQQHASDGGPLGPDPDFGHGIINLGWAMSRSDFNRIDTAVSSQYFDPATFEMQFVVQNRSARGVGGLTLDVNVGIGSASYSVPFLGPGGTHAVRVPVDYFTLKNFGRIDYRTTLINPPGIFDVIPSNNTRSNIISLSQSP